jgi:hypothetical protein
MSIKKQVLLIVTTALQTHVQAHITIDNPLDTLLMSPFSSLIDSFQLRAQWREHSSGCALKSEWALRSAARRTDGLPVDLKRYQQVPVRRNWKFCGRSCCRRLQVTLGRLWVPLSVSKIRDVFVHSPRGVVDREVEGTAETTGSTQRHGVTFRITAKLTTKLHT